MPLAESCLVILVAALGGLLFSVFTVKLLFRPHVSQKLFGLELQGILPSMMPALAGYASAKLGEKFENSTDLSKKIADPELLEELKPTIEAHVDSFLKVRLKEAFPLLANFMGEKTLLKFKEAFLTEVQIILPDLLISYSKKFFKQLNLQESIAAELKLVDLVALEKLIRDKAGNQLKFFYFAGTLLGSLIGLIQVILVNVYSNTFY
ncbi:MAG: hypothetical protein EOO06_17550 [Chitinophagaceae bacterium]|nr:MAG: hypothetical protein EOO06_17550 [Chitinophagaceae bacterium]